MKIQPVLTQNSNAVWNFFSKMGEISDIDWAQYIKMDYAQNLSKDPKKVKQTTFRRFKEGTAWYH